MMAGLVWSWGSSPKGLKAVSYRTQVPAGLSGADAGPTALPWFVGGPGTCLSMPGTPDPGSAKAMWAAGAQAEAP